MTETPRRRSYRSLWLEYRVAAQFAETWERAVDNVELVRMRQSQGQLPGMDDSPPGDGGSRVKSAAYWMQQVDVPGWFVHDHLGIGTSTDYYRTQSTLPATNARRRRRYDRQVEQLQRARKVLKRTRKW